MVFTSKILVERTATASRASVKEREFICHVFVRSDNLSGVVIADHEYPQRVAHTLINKVFFLDEFQEKCPKPNWSTVKYNEAPYPQLLDILQKYQNPKEADAMAKIQSELDETKIILHNTIEAVLQRGEKLDDRWRNRRDLASSLKHFT
jgi:synaptobrevin family protein YKT6